MSAKAGRGRSRGSGRNVLCDSVCLLWRLGFLIGLLCLSLPFTLFA
jgi:hypothetical protein